MEPVSYSGSWRHALEDIGQELLELRQQDEEAIRRVASLRRSALEIAAELQRHDAVNALGVASEEDQQLLRSPPITVAFSDLGTGSATRLRMLGSRTEGMVGMERSPLLSQFLAIPQSTDDGWPLVELASPSMRGGTPGSRSAIFSLPTTVTPPYDDINLESGIDSGASSVNDRPSVCELSPIPPRSDDDDDAWHQRFSGLDAESDSATTNDEDNDALHIPLECQQHLFEWGHLPNTRTSDTTVDGVTGQRGFQHDSHLAPPFPSSLSQTTADDEAWIDEQRRYSGEPVWWRNQCTFCGSFMVGNETVEAHHAGSVDASVFDTPVYECGDCDLLFCSPQAVSQHAALTNHAHSDGSSRLFRFRDAAEMLRRNSFPGHWAGRSSSGGLGWLMPEEFSETEYGSMMYDSEYDSEGEQLESGCCQETLDLLLERRARTCDLDDACPICLDDIQRGDELLQLPCGHAYHPHCILAWLRHSTQCPVCKRDCEDLLYGRTCQEDGAVGTVDQTSGSPQRREGEPRWTSHTASDALSAAADSVDAATQHIHSAEAACAAMQGILSSPAASPLWDDSSPAHFPVFRSSFGVIDPLPVRSSSPTQSASSPSSSIAPSPHHGRGETAGQCPALDDTQPADSSTELEGGFPPRPTHTAPPLRPTQRLVSVFVSSNTIATPPPVTDEPTSPASSSVVDDDLRDDTDDAGLVGGMSANLLQASDGQPQCRSSHHGRSVSEGASVQLRQGGGWRPPSVTANGGALLGLTSGDKHLERALSAVTAARGRSRALWGSARGRDASSECWSLPAVDAVGESSESRLYDDTGPPMSRTFGRASSHPHITAVLRHSLEMLKEGTPVGTTGTSRWSEFRD